MTKDRRAQAYSVLEVEPGATSEEIRSAYRDLVKVWHPDRFPNDERLRKRAEEQTKLLNDAYAYLCSCLPPARAPQPSAPGAVRSAVATSPPASEPASVEAPPPLREHQVRLSANVEHHLFGTDREITAAIERLLREYPPHTWGTWVVSRSWRGRDGTQYALISRQLRPVSG